MNKRILSCIIFLPFLLVVAGCANSTSEKLASLALNYLKGTNEKVPRERAAEIPYASMGLEYGFSPQVLLVLGMAAGDGLDWYAGDAVFVRTQRGRITRTAGLPNDLGGRHLTQVSGAAMITYALDFPDLGVFGAVAQCSSTNAGDESVEILGNSILTRHVVEHCSVPTIRWRFDNEYWEDRMTGYVWRSRQYVHPKSPPIVLEVFRPEDLASG